MTDYEYKPTAEEVASMGDRLRDIAIEDLVCVYKTEIDRLKADIDRLKADIKRLEEES